MLQFYRTTVGKKTVMAVTGLFLFLFTVGHMVGNLKMFQGIDAQTGLYKIDAYAAFLRNVGYPLFGHGELLLFARLGLLAAAVLHIVSAFFVVRANREARPQGYVKEQMMVTNYAARTMWLGGVVILVYLVFHILHFTTGDLHHHGFEEGKVYHNVVSAFQNVYNVAIYIIAMAALCAHLSHGLWSAAQTLGLNQPKWQCHLKLASRVIALGLVVGYISVPLAIFFGHLK